ncbi:MAG: dTDP-glucose 4,6-dehydratase [Anaerolineae bacterium]|jgi:dTDP-glucose 4,6-dehydratase|nr:dTDP-glucose 4,6-dehydratase [Anaerolineae bacterium]MBT7190775.1 dTDP-glucose 4,6-dehydratase [Anaerolineae bacterium]MBT7990832.1 dTDP-glucose 4,6-dehydratase [Anaerolineae bacterium]
MKNILITGGAGFIGSNFIRYLLEKEPDLEIIDLDILGYAGSLENLKGLPDPERHTFVQGDICDADLVNKLMQEHKIDTIVHFAAESHVDRSILGPAPFVQTNVFGTLTLLEAAKQAWGDTRRDTPSAGEQNGHFHHISTDEVFGTLAPDEPAFVESTAYDPRSPYSASKASSDHLVRSYFHTYGLPLTVTNCSNNYGPYQFPEKLIPLMILNATQGKPLPIYGDGLQIRDWLHVEDHCEAIYLVLKGGKMGETYNVGGGNQPANLDLVNRICSILDLVHPASVPYSSLISYVRDRPGHDRRYAVDSSKIKAELGWEPHHSLEEGLSDTVKWYLDNMDWVETILKEKDYQAWLDKNYEERGKK